MAAGSIRPFTFAAAAGSLLLLAVVVYMLWPSDPTGYALTFGREQTDGETVGWVSKVQDNTIHVSSGPFGGGVVPLLVTRNTRITIGSKEAWFEDIRPGGQVKVAYEISHGKRLARTVELLVEEGARSPVRPERLKSTVGGVGTDRAATRTSAADASPGTDARPIPIAPEPAPATSPDATPPPAASSRGSARASRQTVQTRPAPLASPEARPTARPESTRIQAETPAPPRVPASPGPPAPTPARPSETARTPESGDVTDGSAAVDWLLKGRR